VIGHAFGRRLELAILLQAGLIIGKGGSNIKYLQRELGCRITTDKKKDRTTVTGESVRSEAIEIFEARMNEILADPDAFSEAMQAIRNRKLHVFVDASNIMISSQIIGNNNERDTSIRIRVDKLIEIVTNGRHIENGVVLGTNPDKTSKYWNRWRDGGFQVHVFENVTDSKTGRKYEQGVDDTLQTMMSRDVAKIFNPPHTLVLLTGDGNSNNDRVSFPEVILTAVRNDWNVEVWAWKAATSQVYKRFHDSYPSKVSLYDFDQYRSEVTYTLQKDDTVGSSSSSSSSATVTPLSSASASPNISPNAPTSFMPQKSRAPVHSHHTNQRSNAANSNPYASLASPDVSIGIGTDDGWKAANSNHKSKKKAAAPISKASVRPEDILHQSAAVAHRHENNRGRQRELDVAANESIQKASQATQFMADMAEVDFDNHGSCAV
jgi:transcription antitermination factor NusA-like protein